MGNQFLEAEQGKRLAILEKLLETADQRIWRKRPQWDTEYKALRGKRRQAREKATTRMQAALDHLQGVLLDNEQGKDGRTFQSIEELMHYKHGLRLKSNLDRYINLSPKKLREQLARDAAVDTFISLVNDALESDDHTDKVLELFEKLIADFIGENSQGLWPFTGEMNFSLEEFRYSSDDNLLNQDHPARTIANIVVDTFEQLLDDLNAVFNQEFSELTERQQHVYGDLTRHCYYDLIEAFLHHETVDSTIDKRSAKFTANDYGYTLSHPLVKEVSERWGRLSNLDFTENTGDDSEINILYKIEMYPFLVQRRIYDEKDITTAMHLTTFQITPQHYRALIPSAKVALKAKIMAWQQPLREIVKTLRAQRQKNGSFAGVLGIGFSGPLVENPGDLRYSGSKVVLAFSRSGRSYWYHYLLRRLRSGVLESFCSGTHVGLCDVTVDALTENDLHAYDRRNRRNGLATLNNKKLYQFILDAILKQTFLQDNTHIQPDILRVWKKTMIKLLQENINDTDKRNILIQAIDKGSLSNKQYEEVKDLLLKQQHYHCAEVLLSKYGHTNRYIPIQFLPQNKEQVKRNGDKLYAGTSSASRPIVHPCQECQLLAAPYLIWSSFYNGWGLKDMNKAAQQQNALSLQPRYAYSIGASMQVFNDSKTVSSSSSLSSAPGSAPGSMLGNGNV